MEMAKKITMKTKRPQKKMEIMVEVERKEGRKKKQNGRNAKKKQTGRNAKKKTDRNGNGKKNNNENKKDPKKDGNNGGGEKKGGKKNGGTGARNNNVMEESTHNKLWCFDLSLEQILQKCVENKIKN